MGQEFHGNSQVNLTLLFAFFSRVLDLTSLCTGYVTKLSLAFKTDEVTSGRKDVDPHRRLRGCSRGEWVKLIIIVQLMYYL